MKTHKLTAIAAMLAGLCTASSAFTLDFAGYEGVTLPPNPLVIFVPGYGDVMFEAGDGSALAVNSDYLNDNGFGAPSLSFSEGDTVRVTFLGLEPLNVDFDFVGVSAGEAFIVQVDQFASQAFLLTLQGGGDGAGLYAVSFNQIPEPAASLLGAMGLTLLLVRRRR
jgi:hypothetical protein